MRNWLQAVALALVFTAVGAFSASLWLEVRRETPAAPESTPGIMNGRRIRVEVLNGAGVDRMASRATERLRDLGFDVVYYGNADEFGRDTSVAIGRIDSVEPARRVADALDLHQVLQRPDRNLYLDVTVILGTDWVEDGDLMPEEEADQVDTWGARIGRALRRLWPG
jgi:hypothetical protein